MEPSPLEDIVQKRKMSGETIAEDKLTISPICKICKNDLSEKSKEWYLIAKLANFAMN